MAGSKSRLIGAAKELSIKWEQTRNYWHDDKSREFEARFLRELFPAVDKTVAIADKLNELLNKVRTDCD
ncbi:MAG: hypothetical protein KGR98_03680 [Verrucomicrobia bacterium]|nr:hypothetical protein [Verrucomicrobiota bacterium]MDE3097870.1 hypothetical protein [Verrucomicrobiota bacterium]